MPGFKATLARMGPREFLPVSVLDYICLLQWQVSAALGR
jgi:hypothetical protein